MTLLYEISSFSLFGLTVLNLNDFYSYEYQLSNIFEITSLVILLISIFMLSPSIALLYNFFSNIEKSEFKYDWRFYFNINLINILIIIFATVSLFLLGGISCKQNTSGPIIEQSYVEFFSKDKTVNDFCESYEKSKNDLSLKYKLSVILPILLLMITSVTNFYAYQKKNK
jgi:hypothetical protein